MASNFLLVICFHLHEILPVELATTAAVLCRSEITPIMLVWFKDLLCILQEMIKGVLDSFLDLRGRDEWKVSKDAWGAYCIYKSFNRNFWISTTGNKICDSYTPYMIID